jgi:hypothetical protein
MKTLSEKQLAANRANAAKSTGPRTAEGKARAALNARKHGLAAATFTASSIEDTDQLANLIDDAVAFYQPQNSQEQFAVERIALCQMALLRAYRFEAGAITDCFAAACRTPPEITFEPATIDQKNNHALFGGLQHRARESAAWSLVLRYQAQAERQYRRAVEDFQRLVRERDSLNEPISDPQPEETTPQTAPPDEPIHEPGQAPPAAGIEALSRPGQPDAHTERPLSRAFYLDVTSAPIQAAAAPAIIRPSSLERISYA